MGKRIFVAYRIVLVRVFLNNAVLLQPLQALGVGQALGVDLVPRPGARALALVLAARGRRAPPRWSGA